MTNLPTCCTDLDISQTDILFPDRMDAAGQEFCRAHGIFDVPLAELMQGAKLMDNGLIKLQHRCQQLQDDGRCGIYATRPKICREFDCRTRHDCACKGNGVIWNAELDLF